MGNWAGSGKYPDTRSDGARDGGVLIDLLAKIVLLVCASRIYNWYPILIISLQEA